MQIDEKSIVEQTNHGLKKLKVSETNIYKSRNASAAHWSPDVNILLPTSQWLKLYGLKKYKLELKQILSSIGFKHSEEYVRSIQKPVKASYSKGLFPQYSYADGTIYNLLATSEKIQVIVNQLTQVISLYEERLEWLTSSSRLVFGVIQEQTVAIVLDLQCSTRADLNLIKNAFISLVKEQLLFVSKFNFIRCAPELQYWHDKAVNVTTHSISDILKWLYNLQLESKHDISATIDGLYQAAKDGQVESIYFCTDGMSSIKTREILKRKLEFIKVPIHIVALNCISPSCVTFLQDVTTNNTGGRFHKFSLSENKNQDIVLPGKSRLTEMSDNYDRPKMEIGVRKDVVDVWEELDRARNNLAEIQAIQMHVNQKDSRSQTDPNIDGANEKQDENQEKDGKQERIIENELYMSSKEWLKRHSLKAKKLGFYDALSNTAFRHCDGVVEVPNPHNENTMATVKSKLVNAKYCDKFAHVRWKDGQIFHVHISGGNHRNFEKRITAILDSYKQRIQWLQKGSRELFGTIIEDQVTILIDTSASMNSRLFLVKDKLYQLLQEQIKHKQKFNLIKFDSRVQAWRGRMVDCTERNLDDAWQWIKGLVVGGSTNTLDALKLALSDPLCHAVYLLTDGRPDQPPLTVLSQIHLQDSVPIHTISFNCSDDAANDFLFKLSQNTNGRFHYFSENGTDSNIPKTFESEDLRLIKEEIEKGVNDLQRLTRLRNWCAQLDWYGGKSEESGPTRPKSRPSPQHLIDRSKKETKLNPKRTLKKKKIKKRQQPVVKSSDPVSKKEVKSSSSSDSSSEDEKSSVKSQSTESSILASKSLEMSEEEKIQVKTENKLEDQSKSREYVDGNTKNIEKDDEKENKAKKKKKKKTQRLTPQKVEDKLSHTRSPKDIRSPVKESNKSNTPKAPWLRNHKVLARNDVDGFYYVGVLRVNINSRYADVSFCDFESQVVSLRHIIPNEGSRPCPTLKVGDYVLVKTVRDGITCYAPGVVYVIPLRQSKVTKYYTVIHYHGRKATSLRKDLVKISQSRYAFACRYIKDCEMTANKSSSISMFSAPEKKEQFKGKESEEDSSDSSSDSEVGSPKHVRSTNDKHDKQSSSDDENNATREEKKKENVPPDNINEELARIKEALLETKECQVKSLEEQQQRFDDLRQQLKDVMEDQVKRQDELKQHYEALVGGTIEQNELTKEEQDKRIEEARILLQEQQENMLNDFKKQQKLLEELLLQKPGDQKSDSDGEQGLVQDEMVKNRSASQSSSNSNESHSLPAKKSPPETPHENDVTPDENDGAPSKMEFHISSGKEACLWTKGSRGLLISRVPLEEDPAVENRPVPTLLKSGEEVLARWPDDGWYYRGTIREPAGDNYFVEDSVGNMEEISRINIITDEDDAANDIKVNDAVVALHPSFSFSYAPGVVMDVPDNLLYNVRFYDGHEDVVPREEVYFLTQQMFSNAVNFIVCCEESLVGQAVVARNDLDGYFYLATIRERVGNGRQYIVQWPEGAAQVQNSAYIFGAHTKRHQLAVGDKVLCLSNSDRALYEPGWITGIDGRKINVKLSSGKRSNHVDSMQCFWLSTEYYDRIVDYITRNKNR